MRRILIGAAVVVAVSALTVLTTGASHAPPGKTYKVELDNSFGLVTGSDFKVAGVPVGSIKRIELCRFDSGAHCQNPLHAVITVGISQTDIGQFHRDVFCQSRPQSLIGEYYINCEPGSRGSVLPYGSTVSNTQSTIPADLVQNIMRLPYRQRFTILINELGAAVAARSEDLQTALRRADPALAETDNLLNLLANDAHIIQQLNVNADSVISALAKGAPDVQRFVVEANNASSASAPQAANIQATWQKLPAFLEQLRPALAKLGAAADAQDPVLVNLNAAASNLNRFFTDLVPFSHESVPSLQSLGKASQVGIPAVQAAAPTVADLTRFARPLPELARNLAIVLHDLDSRSRAVERDPRSPAGGAGYTGLEAILQYVFNVTLAVNYMGQYGHLLGVDAFVDQTCAPYATPQTIANNLNKYVKAGGDLNSPGSSAAGENPRSCYAWLGSQQPGINVPDPTFNKAVAQSMPGHPNGTNGCVPDPNGYPVLSKIVVGGVNYTQTYHGPSPSSNACKLTPTSTGPAADRSSTAVNSHALPVRAGPTGTPSSGTGGGSGGSPSSGGIGQTIGQVISQLAGGATGVTRQLPPVSVKTGTPSSGGGGTNQAQQLLNYLLAP